jgi:hypothetical protein
MSLTSASSHLATPRTGSHVAKPATTDPERRDEAKNVARPDDGPAGRRHRGPVLRLRNVRLGAWAEVG